MTIPNTNIVVKITTLDNVPEKILKYQKLGYRLQSVTQVDAKINMLALYFFRFDVFTFTRF